MSNLYSRQFSCFIIGEGSLPIQCAEMLLQHDHRLVGMISADSDLRQWAQQHNGPVYYPSDDLFSLMEKQPFDYLFSINNGVIIPNKILTLPNKVAINYHDAPLPKYAGMYATSWAIMHREARHGITWHVMTEKVDAGDILKQVLIDISPHETAFTLNAKCYEAALSAFSELIDGLACDQITPQPQNLAQRTYFSLYKRPPAAGVISWQQTAEEIDALSRALTFGPYPNALGLPKLALGQDLFIVAELEPDINSQAQAGTIISVDVNRDWLTVATTTRDIIIKKILTIDGHTLKLTEVAKQYDLRPGKQLGDLEAQLTQQLRAKSSQIGKHESFWRQRLATLQPLEAPYSVPFGKRVGAISATQGRQVVTVPLSIPDEVMAFLKEHNWQPQHFLCAVFVFYLARLNDVTSFDIGFRPSRRAKKWQILGFFVSEVPLRVEIELDWPFERLYQAIEREIALTRRHKTYARDVVVRYPELKSRPELEHVPLSSVTIAEVEHVGQVKAVSDLTLCIREQGARNADEWGMIAYHPGLFLEGTIERMVGHLQTFFSAVVRHKQPIKSLPLLTEAERKKILVEWNETQRDYPRNKCIHHLFEQYAARMPDAIAVTAGSQQLTYRDLNARANQLAHYLIAQGVGPDVLVGICVERSVEMVVGLLGILKAGGAYLALTPTLPSERLQFMLQDSGAQLLLTVGALVDRLRPNIRVLCLDQGPAFGDEHNENPQTSVKPNHLAYCIYTSGSTGRPKGVQISHQSLVNHSFSIKDEYSLSNHDRVLQFAAFSFDVTAEELFPSWLSGATLVLPPVDLFADWESWHKFLTQEKVTVLNLPASYWHQWVLELEKEHPPSLSLRLVVVGSESISAERLNSWQKKVKVSLRNAYGVSECTITNTLYDPANREDLASVPIGRPIANTQTYILDKWQKPVPIGVPGELYIGGAGIGRGYLNRPQLTQEKFIPNPFSPPKACAEGRSIGGGWGGARLYKTGDLCRYLPDGNIEFLGRIDHQVKIRGFRIELGEIEACLSQHESVRDVAVVVHERATDKRLVAYLVSQQPVSHDELHTYLSQKLPAYMIPSAFVQVETMPLTPNGKIDRRALPAPSAMGRGGEGARGRWDDGALPRTPKETILAAIWQEVLGVQVGIHDNFFDIGGHSLLAMQVVSRIRQSLQVELPLRRLFSAPTIAELAQQLTSSPKACPGPESAKEGRVNFGDESVLPPIEPLDRTARTEPLPLSFAQQRLWFLAQLEGSSDAYNIPAALRLSGPLDMAALSASWQAICERHEALRTSFPPPPQNWRDTGRRGGGQPRQQINHKSGKLELIDLSDLPKDQQEAEVARLSRQEVNYSFDLVNGPLWRMTLLRLSSQEHVLLLTMHHIISDDWSIGVLGRELSALYAVHTGATSQLSLPHLPVQYADFAVWQREWLQGEVLQAQLDYWKKQLADAPPLLTLPTDHPRPAVQSYRGSHLSFTLSGELTDSLKHLSQKSNTTLFMTLQAAFAVLLSRYSGQQDILIGTPIANRQVAEVENLIGFFVNTLALRNDLSGNPTFRDVLARVRQVTLDAYQHQALPFELLVETLQPERSLSHSPLFQVMFTLENNRQEALSLADVTVSSLEIDYPIAKFDLTLTMQERKEALIAWWEYNTDLFERATIERMAGHFETLLKGIVANPDQSIAHLPLLTEREKHQLLVEWNNTKADYPSDKCIHQLFEQQVARTPEAIAVIFGEKQLTYHSLAARANQLAHHLINLGVGPDVLVGICIERSLEMVVGLLGILKAGGAYVPLDPAYPQERLQFMLKDSGVQVLLTTAATKIGTLGAGLSVLCLEQDWELIQQEHDANPQISVKPNHLAYCIYTSGSTGKPKGVQISHQSLTNFLHAMSLSPGLTAKDKLLAVTTISFDIAALELYLPLIVGAQVILASREECSDGQLLLKKLKSDPLSGGEGSDVTVMQATPATWRMLLAAGWQGSDTACPLGIKLLCGGEALPYDLAQELRRLVGGDHAPRLWNMYGPTETTIWSTTTNVTEQLASRGIVSIGQPILNTQLYILDRYQNPVPIGVPGELHLGGAGVARGYLNRPQLTAEKFIPNPFGVGKLYKTGDLARYLPDGNIEFLGRIDNQVKIRGFRIELGEIEANLRQCVGVREAVVVVRDSERGKQLVAYVVTSTGSAQRIEDDLVDETETTSVERLSRSLRANLSQKLPDYMIPSAFVALEALPLTPNGKIDRRALPAPDMSAMSPQETFVPPRTPTETTLAHIWSEVLKIEPACPSGYGIGIHDNFFDLGGHSLLATQVVSRVQEAFQLDLPIRALFESPTIMALAERLEDQQRRLNLQDIYARPLSDTEEEEFI